MANIWGVDELQAVPKFDVRGMDLTKFCPRIRSFFVYTALGVDEWEPWSWRLMSDEASA